jgi:pimeloyl-ACP methyl ester carboxylesterase
VTAAHTDGSRVSHSGPRTSTVILRCVTSEFDARDGVRLAYRELGHGRPLILLHGLAGDGSLWQRNGQAEALAAAGHRVILPDFRGHGASAKPHDPAAYPPDILVDDSFALLDHLGIDDYDLGGYSLGGRIVVRMLVREATPRRAIVGGQGLREVQGIGGGAGAQLRRIVAGMGTFPPGSPEARAEQWYRDTGADPTAQLQVLDSIVATPVEPLHAIEAPTLVVMGTDDERAVSATDLVEALPNGVLAMVPGDHRSAVSTPQLRDAMLQFLGIA